MAVKLGLLCTVLLALLLAGLFVGIVKAASINLTISPSEDEAVQKIQLSTSDYIVGNFSVENGSFIDFFVTSPSYNTVYESIRTSFETFNITANETGTYVMHFLNKYQSSDVNVSLSYGINIFRSFTQTTQVYSTFAVNSQTTITHVKSNLQMDVNPPQGFPAEGDYWHFIVSYQNQSSDGTINLYRVPNAIIEITILESSQKVIENITTDENGEAQFQFWSKYTDIYFQAVSGENVSDIHAVTQESGHWVQPDLVNSLTDTATILLGITSVYEGIMLTVFRKRIKTVFCFMMGVILFYSLVQILISKYMESQLTPWGYPSSVFGPLTWNVLQYTSYAFLALFVLLNVIAFLPKLNLLTQPKE
jgi:hypothetical protein